MAIGLSEIINNSAEKASLSQEFAQDFRKRLLENEGILNEYIYFLKNGSFLCEYKIKDMSIADIMVYQIDHFKAAMDQDRLDMKFNPDKMLLMAVDCMLKMETDTALVNKIHDRIFSESGTDGTEMGTKRF